MEEISRNKARTIISKALAHGREAGCKPLAVLVLDQGGHPKAFEREDGATPGRFKIAEAKAYGCLMLGMGGRAQKAAAEANPNFFAAVNGALDGKVLPVEGGVLIRDKKGTVIGAVGISGDSSENDAAAAVAGITAANFTAEA